MKNKKILFIGAIVSILILSTTSSVNSYSNKDENNCECLNFKNIKIIENPIEGHGIGHEPSEMDLSHLTGKEIPKRYISVMQPPTSLDWRSSGKVTPVKDQGACNSCYAFASIACFESKVLIHNGGTYDLSEDNVKECEYYQSCCNPSNFFKVASFLSQSGTVLESCDPYQPVHNNNPPCGTCTLQHKLLDWRIVSDDSIPSTDVLKSYVYNKGPIYVSIWSGSNPYDATWKNEFSNYDGTYTLYKPWSGNTDHAVLLIGWDDNLNHAGGTGGWICKNSWGTNWGGTCGYGTEKGYFTIAYDSAGIGRHSSFVDQWGKHDGIISYYDEGGWNYNWGYSSKTAWGLCTHGFNFDSKVTRVEFWTTDKTTDIDVYIYDTFDGTTLSDLLWSSLDHSFEEAGYHGVAVVPPLNVMGMNAIYVVVKFTNKNYQYPVASDKNGPTVTGFTYTSADGTSGSWFDRGTGSPKSDVAIRLRTSGSNPPTKPTISGPSSGKPNTAYTYNFVSTDSNGDKISYYIKWGDGAETDWTPFRNSGSSYIEIHTWTAQGTYTIKAKARDIYGVESDWETFVVNIPKGKLVKNIFSNLLYNHPYLFPIIKSLLKI